MKNQLLLLLFINSLFAYDSHSVGMSGVGSIPLGVMGGGENPAFVDLNALELEFLGGIGTV